MLIPPDMSILPCEVIRDTVSPDSGKRDCKGHENFDKELHPESAGLAGNAGEREGGGLGGYLNLTSHAK